MSQKLKFNVLLPVMGLEIDKAAEYIDSRGTPDCGNIEIRRTIINKRIGNIAVGSTLGERILAIRELYSGGTYYVLRIGLTKVELLDQFAGTWSDVTGVALTGTATDRIDTALPLLSGLRIMVFSNNRDVIRKYSGIGNTADLGGTPPKAKYLIAYGGYLVLFNVTVGATAYPQRGQWSDTGDIENYSTGNAGYMDLIEDGEDITGAALYGNYIAVHKESSINLWYLTSTDDIFATERKNVGAGAINHFTIQNLPNGEQIYLSRDGIHLFNGVSAPLIPSPIMDELRETMNPEYLYRAWSTIIRELDEYWVGVPIGSETEAQTIYKYNYRTGQIYKDHRTNPSAVGLYTITSTQTWADQIGDWSSAVGSWDDVTTLKLFPAVLFGNSSGDTARRDNVYLDDTEAIDSYWISKDFEADENDKGRLGRWEKMQLWAKGNSLTIDYSIDAGQTWTNINTVSLSADYPTDSAPQYVYFDVVSSKIRFRFSNNTASETFYLKQFCVWYVIRELRE